MTRFERLPWVRERRRDGSLKNRETSEVMEPIRAICRRLHLRCERNNTGLARGLKNAGVMKLHTAGMWDLEVFVPDAGCSVMVECKMPGEGLEPAQAEWGKVYRACGKETIVATSVYEFLRDLDLIRERRRKWSASRTS
jgi:hypothetical protein